MEHDFKRELLPKIAEMRTSSLGTIQDAYNATRSIDDTIAVLNACEALNQDVEHVTSAISSAKLPVAIKIRSVIVCPVVGFGYWKDNHKTAGLFGHTHNIVLPFVRIQFGGLLKH